MTKHNAPSKARQLNMEEKRKLEKLLLSDIDQAISRYKGERQQERSKVDHAAIAKAPPEAKALFTLHENAEKEAARAAKELEKLGYWARSHELTTHYSTKPKIVRDFDAETSARTTTLENMKRTYTLKLFAGGEEAKELFASLARELAAIVK